MTDANSRDRDQDEILKNIQRAQATFTAFKMMQSSWVKSTEYLLNTQTTFDIFYIHMG
jgi:hypothetical protein